MGSSASRRGRLWDAERLKPAADSASTALPAVGEFLGGRLLPPRLYSTELARSVELAFADSVQIRRERFWPIRYAVSDTEINPEGGPDWFRPLDHMPLSTNLIYGLVNVRTYRTNVLCATMEEVGSSFDVKVFQGRRGSRKRLTTVGAPTLEPGWR